MNARPELTAAQKEGAGFALAELRRLYVARLDYMQIGIGFLEILDHYGLPQPAALPNLGATDSLAALARAIDELAGDIERAVIVKPDTSASAAGDEGADERGEPALHLDDKSAPVPLRVAA